MRRNLNVLGLVYFFIYLLPYTPMAVIIFEELTGSYVKATSVFAVMCLTSALLEVPTGVLSDKWGRKKTLTIGSVFCFLNVACLALAYHHQPYALWYLYAAALFQGTAEALYSGNNEALIYDTLGVLRQTRKFPKVFGRMESMTQAGLAISGLLSGVVLLGGFSNLMLIYASLATCFVYFVLSLLIADPPEHFIKDTHPWMHILSSLKKIRSNEKLKLYSIVNMVQLGAMNSTYFFTPGFIGTVWPSWLTATFRTLQHSVGSLGFWNAGRMVKRFGTMPCMIVAPLISNITSLIAYWITNFFSPFLLALGPFAFSTWATAKATIEQESFSQEQRATMGSLISLGSSIATASLSILMGWMADVTSLGTTLFIMMAARTICVNGAYAMIYKRFKK